MKANYLKVMIAVTAVVLFSGVNARAVETTDVRNVAGEITWVDVNLGKLQLKNDATPSTGEITEYRINTNDTRVTDPTDKKFLTIEDLQPGQHVIIDIVNGQEEQTVQKITADPRPTSEFQEAYGEVEAIDGIAGTMTLSRRPIAGEAGDRIRSYFVFEPKTVIVMQSPSPLPVQIQLKPSDLVKVEYVVKDGKQWAHSITVYSPKVTSTVTTTTVTTTQ